VQLPRPAEPAKASGYIYPHGVGCNSDLACLSKEWKVHPIRATSLATPVERTFYESVTLVHSGEKRVGEPEMN
jgi:hypothetical protein